MKKLSTVLFVVIAFSLVLTGCISYEVQVPGEQGQDIITAEEALEAVKEENTILIDAQSSGDYSNSHIKDTVNISRSDITVLGPFPNMLAPASKIEETFSENGISNNMRVIAYDSNNNMDAARLWWTMKVYGHENVQVVSGGLKALQKAGAVTTSNEEPEIETTQFETDKKNTEMIATKEEVLEQVNNPSDDVVLLDVRTQEEFSRGTIPDSVHINYVKNNNPDGTYKSIDEILEIYPDNDVNPDQTVIMYCKTSIRAAQTYLALHNAGYRDLKIYDAAWMQWGSDTSLPVEVPEGSSTETNFQDGS